MTENFFATMNEQSIELFKELAGLRTPEGRRAKQPLWTIGAAPKDFRMRIVKMIGLPLLKQTFSSFMNIEDLKPTQNAGKIAVIIPNEAEKMTEALEKLKDLPNYHREIWITSHRSALCQQVLEKSGLEKSIKVSVFQTDMCLVEDYMMLVHTPHAFRRVFGEGDIEDLTTISKALVKFEILNGCFPEVHSVGENAARVKHILEEMKAQIDYSAFNSEPQFDSLVIIDRTVDLLSPLLSPTSYGGILCDILKPDTTYLTLPDDIQLEGSNSREILLSDNDKAYVDIRGLEIGKAIDIISQKIDAISDVQKQLQPGMDYNSFKVQKARAEDLQALTPFLKCHLDLMVRLGQLKQQQPGFRKVSVFEANLLNGWPDLPPKGEKSMNRDEHWFEILRQYALACVAQRGLNGDTYSMLKRRLVQRFGMPAVDDIMRLEHSNLIYQEAPLWQIFSSKQASWNDMKKQFRLSVEDKKNPEDLGDFFDGWVPVICRIAERLSFEKSLTSGQKKVLEKHTPYTEAESAQVRKHNRMFVFVIGGITETEVTMLRAIGKRLHQGSYEIYIGSTAMITGKQLMEETCSNIMKKLAQAPQPTVTKK